MSIDRSLRVQSLALKTRSVLTRMERVQKLEHARKWKDGDSVIGLPKVRTVFKQKKKEKKETTPAAAGAAGAAAAAPAAAAAKKPAAKK